MTNRSNVVRLNDLIFMMHYTLDGNEVMFDKPFQKIEEVEGFKDWLNRNHVMDSRILSPEWDELTYEGCIWSDRFILSKEAIALCTKALKTLQPKTRVLLTSWVEEQVTLILKRSEKVA